MNKLKDNLVNEWQVMYMYQDDEILSKIAPVTNKDFKYLNELQARILEVESELHSL